MLIRERLLRILALFSLILFGLMGILFYYQVIRGPRLASQAAVIRSRSISLKDIPRGDILDRNGLPLTGQHTVWAVYCLPHLIEDPGKAAINLGRLLDVDSDRVKQKITQARRRGEFFVLIKCPVDKIEREKLAGENMPGVFCAPVKLRYQDNGFCIHLLGHVTPRGALARKNRASNRQAYSPEEWMGVSGIEKRYEEVLKTNESAEDLVAVLDARGQVIPGLFCKVRRDEQAGGGRSVILTIDRRVQQAVEQVMDYRVKKGAVVVVDIHSREILAMASRPVYDPYRAGEFLQDGTHSPFLNRAFGLYHPGSLFKLVVACVALEEGLVSPQDKFTCDGKYVFNKQVAIACWREEGHGRISMKEAVAQSCNSAFIQIGAKVGRDRLLRYADKIRLLNNEIVGYPGVEGRGYIEIEPAAPAMGNASIGQQGVVLTPVQIASLMCTIADDGRWTLPSLVRGIRGVNGQWECTFTPPPKEQVISRSTAAKLQEMLRLAVEEGTGQRARLDETSCAGKTASSQTGRFHPDGSEVLNTWFAGYFPADKPRWAIVVLAEDGASGGETCAPVFKEIATAMLKLL